MKTNLTILAVLILFGCAKQNKEPEPVKKYLSVSVTRELYLDKFQVNGTNVGSPALVKTGDKVYVYAHSPIYPGTLTVSQDGAILYNISINKGTKELNFEIK